MNAFPHSKIKAQILLEDEKNIGRISSKAIELMSACSALFVRDLVVDSSCLQHRKSTKSVLPTTAQGENNTVVTEGESGATNHEYFDRLPPSSPIDLACIKHNIQGRPEYDFLQGVLGELTENNAPKYDAVARKRKRHPVNTKQQSTCTKSNDNTTITHRDVLTNLTCETAKVAPSMKNKAANVCTQMLALEEAIDDAQDATSHHATKEIIPDNDDYD
jgi:hypothetical protein